MQDMLKKIIEIDEKAREIKEKAEKEKAMTEKEVANTRKEIYNDYLNRAKIRVEKNLSVDREQAEKNWEVTKARHENAIAQLDADYANCHEKWSDEIVNRVISM